ncbi:MAG: OmpA family protein [Bacteroidales bacterium]|nr:OmpA family protein [Bacteroidales bacterium]
MLKKVSKLAVLLCMLAIAGSTYAQEEVPEYPQYGFWSNWSIGPNISLMYEPDVKGFYGVKDPMWWGGGLNFGPGITFQKEVDRGTFFRIRANWTSILNSNKGYDANRQVNPWRSQWLGITDPTITMDRHAAITADYVLSLNNSFHNWDPSRRFSIYVFAGGGLAWSVNQARAAYNWGIQFDAGLGASYRVCDRSTLYFELEADILGDAPAFWKKGVGFHHTDFLATIGYLYHLGITAADKELIAQRALLTKANFDALTAENEAVKDELAQAKDNEKKLKDQIEKLNAQANNVNKEELVRAQQVSDSLNNILDKLKADQLNYYAIPFSVLYANDDWHVSSYEMIKVKAVSRVMKDNPDLKLTIVGFCDYTASDAYNMKLSQKRAEEVKRLMVNKYGIDPDRLKVDWKGKTVAFGDIHYWLNRRVSFYRVIE